MLILSGDVCTVWQAGGCVDNGPTEHAATVFGLQRQTFSHTSHRVPNDRQPVYVVCPKSKCTNFLFKCLLDSPGITSYLLQSMTLGKLHSGSVFFH